jgi:hypothetical protein
MTDSEKDYQDYSITDIRELYQFSRDYLLSAQREAALENHQLESFPLNFTDGRQQRWFSITAIIRHARLLSGMSFSELDDLLDLERGSCNHLAQGKNISTTKVNNLRLMVFVNISREVSSSGLNVYQWWFDNINHPDTKHHQYSPLQLISKINKQDDIDHLNDLLNDYQDDFKLVESYLIVDNQERWREGSKLEFIDH